MRSYLKESIWGYGFAYSILSCLAESTDVEGRLVRMENWPCLPALVYRLAQ